MEVVEKHSVLNMESIPSQSLLTANHFDGLENLAGLSIKLNGDNQVTADNNFLTPLKNLISLEIQHLILADGKLNVTSSKLQILNLTQTGVKRLPKAVYASPYLVSLRVISDIAFDAVAIPPSLQLLKLLSPATTLLVNSVPALKMLNITNWTEPQPQPLTSCDNLQVIYLTSPAAHTLPHRWLGNCSKLEEVVIENALNLTKLPKKLFGRYFNELKKLFLKGGVLESLNEGQFYGDNGTGLQIHEFSLNNNCLRTIPKDTLPTSSIMDLSANDFVSIRDIFGDPARVPPLNTLNLGDNPRFDDYCAIDDRLIKWYGIQELLLYNTNVSQLCPYQWWTTHHIKTLDLRNTSVHRLKLKDLQSFIFPRKEVLLEGAPVTLLEATSGDIENVKFSWSALSLIRLGTNARFQCDCRMYWTWRVLMESPHLLHDIGELRCMNGKFFNESIADELVCARSEECAAAGLPDTCTCSERPDDDPSWDKQLLRVDCTGAALTHMPRLPPAEDRLYELLLADNQITNLHATDLDNVKILDLRNNSITRVNYETASQLGTIVSMLWLAGNPLECDCNAALLLLVLKNRNPRYTDLKQITCSNGRALQDASIEGCSPSILAYVASLAVLFSVVVAVTVYLASRKRRFLAKAVLHRWGFLCCLDVDEDDRRYDAFITFSHKDEDTVYKLMSRLEPPYRLCVHHRDWIPGLWIPDQIVDSVRESRRTLALVSRHFLASSWARAEFREAHAAAMLDARPRLIVILLEDPATLALDKQLQRYIATHTYLRWGDPWFYDKLAVALPRPRRPQFVTVSGPLELPSTSSAHQSRSKNK